MSDRDYLADMSAAIADATGDGDVAGEQQGIGASRSQGFGRYEVTRWEPA